MTTIFKVRDVQFWLHVGITWKNLGKKKNVSMKSDVAPRKGGWQRQKDQEFK